MKYLNKYFCVTNKTLKTTNLMKHEEGAESQIQEERQSSWNSRSWVTGLIIHV